MLKIFDEEAHILSHQNLNHDISFKFQIEIFNFIMIIIDNMKTIIKKVEQICTQIHFNELIENKMSI